VRGFRCGKQFPPQGLRPALPALFRQIRTTELHRFFTGIFEVFRCKSRNRFAILKSVSNSRLERDPPCRHQAFGLSQLGTWARKVLSMSSVALDVEVDVIEEMRLRTWARENYVGADERSENWHPIILEEMNRKDEELDASNE
jgi:hypothetical protein